jgi:peptidoglycan/LPS O-acetylase OafA/YrhL
MAGAYAVAGWFAGRFSFFNRQIHGFAPSRHELCDGLRGLLAMSVLFHHIVVSFYAWTGHGWLDPSTFLFAQLGPIPVHLFFAISGFLFWQKLKLSPGRISWGRFYLDRLRRLAPAYYVSFGYLLFLVFLQSKFRLFEPLPEFFRNAVPWLTFGVYGSEFSNLNLAFQTSLLNAGVFWSLRYEWFFYLSLFFMPWFARGNRIFPLLFGVTALYFFLRYAVFAEVIRQGNAPWFVSTLLGFLTYFVSAFAIGMLAAHFRMHFPSADWGKRPLFAVLGTLSFLFVIGVQLDAAIYVRLPLYCLLLGFFFFTVIFGNDLFGLLRTDGAKIIGLVSYSLYVWHGLVLHTICRIITRLVALDRFAEPVLWAGAAVVLTITLLVSMLSYRFVEFPFLRKAPLPRAREKATAWIQKVA